MTDRNNFIEYIPKFKISLLHPRYWLYWSGVLLIITITIIPVSLRDPLLAKVGVFVGKLGKKARRRARINLFLCLPEYSESERESVIDSMFGTALQSLILMAELVIFGPEKIHSRIRWQGMDIINKFKHENVIFLVPHGWGVDIPAMLLAAQGKKMAAMFHHQKNPVFDFVWNIARRRFGGRLHARKDGIKPFIQSVRHGYWGYYLPDQDHGPEHSEFADFFSTYKATLPVAGRLMRLCRARIVPLFPVYNARTHQLTIIIRPSMDDLLTINNIAIARRMNEEIEILVRPHLDQYIWILKLLKTRKNEEIEPYKHEELYPLK